MYTNHYQSYSTVNDAYSPFQTDSFFINDPCMMCHHASRHQSILSTVANALFNYYLIPQTYLSVVSTPMLEDNRAAIIITETSGRRDTAKANESAKMQFSPAYKASNYLKDLIENMKAGLPQFEKSPALSTSAKKLVMEAECLTTQEPGSYDREAIEAFITAVDIIQNEFIQLQNQMEKFEISQAKSKKEARANIRNAANALKASFAELEKVYGLHGELHDVFNSRQEFWMTHEKLAASIDEFKAFNLETEKQIAFDFFLLSFIEDEITQAKSQGISIPSHLGILSSITEQNFTQKITSALKKFNMAPLSATQIKEIKIAIIDTMLTVEKKEIKSFLNSLKTIQEEFASNDYMTIVEHYDETIGQFEDIAKKLSFETIDTYIDEWNDLLIEFDPQHQHLLKLCEAEKAMQTFSNEAREWHLHITDSKCQEIFTKLNNLYSFRYKKNLITDAEDIEAYIHAVYSFIEEAKKQIAFLSL